MNKHKLVPVEPTPEMVEAAEDAYMPFGDMDLALRMAVLAAPDVQGEPSPCRWVQCERCHGNGEIITDWERYENPRPGDAADAFVAECPDCRGVGRLHVATEAMEQQPDVTQLVEALELIAESCDVGRHDGLPEEGPAHCATESWLIAKDALSAYRKGGEL